VTLRILPVLLVVAGCYCSHRADDDEGGDDRADGSMLRDGEVADGGEPVCAPSWGSCSLSWTATMAAMADSPTAPDIAYLGDGVVGVAYRDGDQAVFARVDGAGTLMGETELGNLGEVRMAVHPALGAVVAGDRALRWLSPTFEPIGEPIPNRPMGAEAFGVDVAAVPDGYLLFAVPGGPMDPPSLVAALDGEPATPVFTAFADREPLLPYEHAEDESGFATHVGFEAGPGGIFPLAYAIEGSSPGGLVGVGDSRGATTFIDGVVEYRDRVFLYYQGFSATLIEVSSGMPTVHQLAEVEGTGNNGHLTALADDRVVLFLTETDGTVVARPWRPDRGVGAPLRLAEPDGRRTRDLRSAPSAQGLLAAWECEAGICAASIECCPRP
jgi:hypothetical protein